MIKRLFFILVLFCFPIVAGATAWESATSSYPTLNYAGDRSEGTPYSLFYFSTSTWANKRALIGINSATTSPFSSTLYYGTDKGFDSCSSGGFSGGSGYLYATTSGVYVAFNMYIPPVSSTCSLSYSDYWFVTIDDTYTPDRVIDAVHVINIGSSTAAVWSIAEISGGTGVPDTISILSPSDGSLVATSTLGVIDVGIEYTLNASSIYDRINVFSTAGGCLPSYINQYDKPIIGLQYFECPVNTVINSTTITATLSAGSVLSNITSSITLYPEGNTSTSTLEIYAIEACNGLTCSISDPTGCIKQGLCWAFIPQTSQMPNWGLLSGAVGKKPPFGYIAAMNSGLSGITGNGSPAYTLMDQTTKDDFSPVFGPIRAALAWIFFFAGAIWLYNRSKHIQV